MESEREKMLRGILYDSTDPELLLLRDKAEKLYSEYNATVGEKNPKRLEILRQLLGEVKNAIVIRPPFYCDYGCNIFAGENLYINFNCVILDCAKVTFGNNVFVGPGVHIYAGTHPSIAKERIKGPEFAKPITIGNNVWIGGSAIICPGVTIGDNTTIGAGSIVTKDIPHNVFAAGNPCKVIKDLAD